MKPGGVSGNANFVTNVFYNRTMTDMETCFRAVRGPVESLSLGSNRFGIEPEITATLFKPGGRVHEVPVTYEGGATPWGRRSPGGTGSRPSGR